MCQWERVVKWTTERERGERERERERETERELCRDLQIEGLNIFSRK